MRKRFLYLKLQVLRRSIITFLLFHAVTLQDQNFQSLRKYLTYYDTTTDSPLLFYYSSAENIYFSFTVLNVFNDYMSKIGR